MTPEQVTIFFTNVDTMILLLRMIFTLCAWLTLVITADWIGGKFLKWIH